MSSPSTDFRLQYWRRDLSVLFARPLINFQRQAKGLNALCGNSLKTKIISTVTVGVNNFINMTWTQYHWKPPRNHVYFNSHFHFINVAVKNFLPWQSWSIPNDFVSKAHKLPPLKSLNFNLLAKDFFFQILAHPVFKMWVIQKPNKVAIWNKRHFEEKKMEIIQHV